MQSENVEEQEITAVVEPSKRNLKQLFTSTKSSLPYENQTVILTGASSTVGEKVVFNLVEKLHPSSHLILASNNYLSTMSIIRRINSTDDDSQTEKKEEAVPSVEVSFLELDLSRLTSVKMFCEQVFEKIKKDELPPLGGILFCEAIKPQSSWFSAKRIITWDGYEKTVQVNFLSNFFLFFYFFLLHKTDKREYDPKIILMTVQQAISGPFTLELDEFDSLQNILHKIFKPQFKEKYNKKKIISKYGFSSTCVMLNKEIFSPKTGSTSVTCCTNTCLVFMGLFYCVSCCFCPCLKEEKFPKFNDFKDRFDLFSSVSEIGEELGKKVAKKRVERKVSKAAKKFVGSSIDLKDNQLGKVLKNGKVLKDNLEVNEEMFERMCLITCRQFLKNQNELDLASFNYDVLKQ
eukprot:snap_masked-scaffold_15-processed-gene-8.35-mRNA-1 protein AED:1.00 eAED:1.00 QI:0/0/0/0/1/1/2/0/404